MLSAAGVQSEARLPFAGLHQLLRPALGGADGLPVRQRAALLTAFGMTEAAAPDLFLIALAALVAGGLSAAAALAGLIRFQAAAWRRVSRARVFADR